MKKIETNLLYPLHISYLSICLYICRLTDLSNHEDERKDEEGKMKYTHAYEHYSLLMK